MDVVFPQLAPLPVAIRKHSLRIRAVEPVEEISRGLGPEGNKTAMCVGLKQWY